MNQDHDYLKSLADMARNEKPPLIHVSTKVLSAIQNQTDATVQTLFYCSVFGASAAIATLIMISVWIIDFYDPLASMFLFANSLS